MLSNECNRSNKNEHERKKGFDLTQSLASGWQIRSIYVRNNLLMNLDKIVFCFYWFKYSANSLSVDFDLICPPEWQREVLPHKWFWYLPLVHILQHPILMLVYRGEFSPFHRLAFGPLTKFYKDPSGDDAMVCNIDARKNDWMPQ